MEDKSLERSVEEIANYCVDGPGSGSSGAGRSVMKRRIVGALQAERDKLRVVEAEVKRLKAFGLGGSMSDVFKKNEELLSENATLKSQITALNKTHEGVVRGYLDRITALKGERDSWLGSKDGKIKGEHWEVVEDAAQTIADLQDQLTTIKELLNGASLHPETGVSLVDDVRDLVKDIAGYKAQVAGQAHYIKCLLDEIRELKEAIREQDNSNSHE